jgi:hypothetical protein
MIIQMTIRPILPFIDYTVNYDYITKELCENRMKPELMCNGKCYLSKELVKTTQEQGNKSPQKISLNSIDNFIINESLDESFILKSGALKNSVSSFYTNIYNLLLYNQFFHPPLV